MGVFSFIETFFFISLGITFVLILLLVYHFKQRVTSIEQKGNTMFEIINNIVKEIGLIKRDCFQCMMPQSQPPLQQQFFAGNSIPVNKITLDNIPEYNPTMEDETDSETDGESESGSETSSGTDTDDEDDDDEDEIQNVASIQQKIVVSDNEDSDNEDSDNEEDDKPEIKIINIDINESIQLVEELIVTNDEPTEVEVTKIEESATVEPNKPDRMAIYNNMSLSELKAKVIELGLSTEPAKMKRPKLLSMLEASLL